MSLEEQILSQTQKAINKSIVDTPVSYNSPLSNYGKRSS